MSTDLAQRPVRVGIVTDGLEERRRNGEAEIANGGVGVYIAQLVRHLRLVEPASAFVLIRHGDGALDIYRQRREPPVILPRSPFTRIARALDRPYGRIVRDLDLDLLHYPNQFGGAFLPASVRRVVTLHDLTPLLFPRQHPWKSVVGYRLLLRRSLRAADHVIVDSSNTRTDLLTRGLVADGNVSVIPLGVDDAFRRQSPTADFARRYDLPERFILTVGVLEPRKNHALLVRALGRLHEHGERVGLVIVGRDGWRWTDPVDNAGAAHLRDWVRIFRNVPDRDLPELYTRASVFAYPSLYEGFGLPVLEAMACGTPVVTSTTSSLAEVAGGAALLTDPTDVDDVSDKLLAALRDPVLRARLSAAGDRQAAQHSWRRTATETLAVYRRVARTALRRK